MLNRWLTGVVSCLRCVSAVPSWSWLRLPSSTARRGTIRCGWRKRWPSWSACGERVRKFDRVSELRRQWSVRHGRYEGEGDAAHGDDRNGQGRALQGGV